jgi:ankyrin repeat protein
MEIIQDYRNQIINIIINNNININEKRNSILLLLRNIKPNLLHHVITYSTSSENNLLYYILKFLPNSYNIINVILENNIDLYEHFIDDDNVYDSAFHISIKYSNDIIILKKLANLYIDNISNIKNNNDNTPLHYSIIYNSTSNIISYLLQNNANPDIFNNEGITPLYYALKNSNLYIISEFIKSNPDLSRVGYTGYTALHAVLYHKRNIKIVNYILNLCDDDMINCRFNSDTPLHYALKYSNDLLVISSLFKRKVNKYAKNNKGLIPLQYCLKYCNNNKIIDFVINKYSNYIYDKYGDSFDITLLNHKNIKIFKELFGFHNK